MTCARTSRGAFAAKNGTMVPYFNGFKGRVFDGRRRLGDRRGLRERGHHRVTTRSVDAGSQRVSRRTRRKEGHLAYENNSTTERVQFKITGYRGKDPIGDLKLQKQFRLSNMHLFHPVQGIKKYSSPLEIIRDFEIR